MGSLLRVGIVSIGGLLFALACIVLMGLLLPPHVYQVAAKGMLVLWALLFPVGAAFWIFLWIRRHWAGPPTSRPARPQRARRTIRPANPYAIWGILLAAFFLSGIVYAALDTPSKTYSPGDTTPAYAIEDISQLHFTTQNGVPVYVMTIKVSTPGIYSGLDLSRVFFDAIAKGRSETTQYLGWIDVLVFQGSHATYSGCEYGQITWAYNGERGTIPYGTHYADHEAKIIEFKPQQSSTPIEQCAHGFLNLRITIFNDYSENLEFDVTADNSTSPWGYTIWHIEAGRQDSFQLHVDDSASYSLDIVPRRLDGERIDRYRLDGLSGGAHMFRVGPSGVS